MTEPGRIERKTGKFSLARTTFLETLEADGIAEAHDVRAYVAREQHSSWTPQKRDLSRAMTRNMNHFEAASDGKYLTSSKRLVDGNRLQSFIGMVVQLALDNTRRNRPGAAL